MRPAWITLGATAAWAATFAASFWASDLIGKPGQSGWDALGQFLQFQFVALGLAVVGLVVLAVLWRRLGWRVRIVTLIPTFVTLAGFVFLAFFD
ncbi:MAG: hypothetical protein AAGK00_06250 [Pseudomonadota bacterium]